jgi:serine O-acetyltransferase
MAVHATQQIETVPELQEPDWSREEFSWWEWAPSRRLLRSIRDYQGGTAEHPHQRILAVVRHRFWSLVTGADIPLNASLGGGLLLPHPNGIVIHPEAKIGPNCLIFQQVTIGTGAGHGLPVLAGHVDIGAGAKILGAVHLGLGAKVGANAVVLEDVPSGAVAVGVPAKVLGSAPPIRRRSRRRG